MYKGRCLSAAKSAWKNGQKMFMGIMNMFNNVHCGPHREPLFIYVHNQVAYGGLMIEFVQKTNPNNQLGDNKIFQAL